MSIQANNMKGLFRAATAQPNSVNTRAIDADKTTGCVRRAARAELLSQALRVTQGGLARHYLLETQRK